MVYPTSLEYEDEKTLVRHLAIVPVFAFVIVAGLVFPMSKEIYDFPRLLFWSNIFFIAVVSIASGYLAARGYIASGSPGLLFLGCGLFSLGCGAVISSWMAGGQDGIDNSIVVYNTACLIAGLFHLTGALSSLHQIKKPDCHRNPQKVLVLSLLGIFTVISIIAWYAYCDHTPLFFIQGEGPTPIRQVVFGSAVALFFLSSLLLLQVYSKTGAVFFFWYSLAMILFSEGLGTVLFQRAVGTPMNWTGRSVQFLGGIYLLIAVTRAFIDSRKRGISLSGIMARYVDISELRKAEGALEESENRFRNLFNFSPEPLALASLDESRLIEVNQAYCDLLGLSRGEIVGRTSIELGIWQNLEERSKIRGILASEGEVRDCEFHLRTKSGDIKTVLLDIETIEFDHSPNMIFALRDITLRKEMEEALRRSHTELELKVQERTAELRVNNRALMDYAAKLERLNRELEEFAFVASHDLQEPLRKIQTFGSLLVKSHKERLDEEAQAHLMRIIGSAKRMSDSIHSLLDYSRITSEVPLFEPVDLLALAQDAAGDLRTLIEQAGGNIEIGSLTTIEVDRAQIWQVFHHMIGHSLKFRKDNEAPMVKIHGEATGAAYSIFVEDNGIGFDEQYLDIMFKPFQQLHSRGKYEGMGMGLALCRKIVERHEGSITACVWKCKRGPL